MANQDHLTIIKQGVETWNEWGKEHPDIKPDLSGADLREADLTRALLRGADLSWADLSGAHLTRADLTRAHLTRTHLSGADLTRADLTRAHLTRADLSGADLSGANLTGANLSGADLGGANLFLTIFADVDLSQAHGLDQVIHDGPSTIGIDTLYRSGGNIPDAFLRGCGVPDQFIEYARALVGKPIEYYSCFVSYSSENQECATRIFEGLQANNVRCWFAPEHMKIGDRIRLTIDESIRTYDKLLLICSEAAINSQWVEHEVEAAFEKERREKRTVLFPIRIDDTVMDYPAGWASLLRNNRHIGDFTCWKDHDAYQRAFQRLLRDLKAAS